MYILFHYCQGFRIDELLPPTSLLLIQVWVHRVLLNSLENPPQGLPADLQLLLNVGQSYHCLPQLDTATFVSLEMCEDVCLSAVILILMCCEDNLQLATSAVIQNDRPGSHSPLSMVKHLCNLPNSHRKTLILISHQVKAQKNKNYVTIKNADTAGCLNVFFFFASINKEYSAVLCALQSSIALLNV